ncbi:hypothetical protein [Vitiosangium sp. GDMCC 1.1324]|uniref:hypothetical protein n=1 Tax=Vitiosangium sp. (strain GDMCC 1.1324) TaxID=2138576 RepID=UPI000D3A8B35|nr:hypothetical protein [Vitiosangium sp. GDMCC 1.1324]PTL84971.1 hypothetical protein DAT35_07965 [Vitiosangium sp. GDMCC 1.1324]
MNDPYKQLRGEYIDALRGAVPAIVRWWNDHCPYSWTEPVPTEAMTDFHRRWPAGPAAHPRVIAIFRQYYFALQELNDRTAFVSRVQPIDLLVNDLTTVAPDLFELMQGFVYIPIAFNPDGEEC